MKIKDIVADATLSQSFVEFFLQTLEDHDERLLDGTEMTYVLGVIQHQGYWSGIKYNFHWNEDTNDFDVIERTFAGKKL